MEAVAGGGGQGGGRLPVCPGPEVAGLEGGGACERGGGEREEVGGQQQAQRSLSQGPRRRGGGAGHLRCPAQPPGLLFLPEGPHCDASPQHWRVRASNVWPGGQAASKLAPLTPVQTKALAQPAGTEGNRPARWEQKHSGVVAAVVVAVVVVVAAAGQPAHARTSVGWGCRSEGGVEWGAGRATARPLHTCVERGALRR